VTKIYNDSVCKSTGLVRGDIILSIDGADPLKMIEDARKYQNASTRASQTFFICSFLLFGQEKQVLHLKVKDSNGKIKNIAMPVLREFTGDVNADDYVLGMYEVHDKPSVRLISKDIVYADLTSPMQKNDFDSLLRLCRNTRGIILDMRGYPHSYFEDVKFAKHPDALIAKFSESAPSFPNVKTIEYSRAQYDDHHVFYQSTNINYSGWIYPGKVVMLINEVSQSAAEHMGLILKAYCDATFIGSPTAGANGMMTDFNIPGKINLWFSGAAVMHPDGKPLQRVGLQPDILVRPTIKGLQEGKDEVLERAVQYLQRGK